MIRSIASAAMLFACLAGSAMAGAKSDPSPKASGEPAPMSRPDQHAQTRYDRCDNGYFMCTIWGGTGPQNWCCPAGLRCGGWYGTCDR